MSRGAGERRALACPEDAISFPEKSEVVKLVKQLRVEYASA